MIHAKNYEKLSKFVKVTAKILSVPFSGHGVVQFSYISLDWNRVIMLIGLFLVRFSFIFCLILCGKLSWLPTIS